MRSMATGNVVTIGIAWVMKTATAMSPSAARIAVVARLPGPSSGADVATVTPEVSAADGPACPYHGVVSMTVADESRSGPSATAPSWPASSSRRTSSSWSRRSRARSASMPTPTGPWTRSNPYVVPPGGLGAFNYAPPIAWICGFFGNLRWYSFLWLWLALLLGTVIFLGRRGYRVIWLLAFPPVALDLYHGNIDILIAAAVALGFRYPWTWGFILLTKVTPGVGLLWFAVRREWRSLAIALGVTGVIVAVSVVANPQLWQEWFAFLRDAQSGVHRRAVPDRPAAVVAPGRRRPRWSSGAPGRVVAGRSSWRPRSACRSSGPAGSRSAPRWRTRRCIRPTSPPDRLRRMSDAASLALILPAFDEEARLGPALDELFGYLGSSRRRTPARVRRAPPACPRTSDVLVVDDGSTDGTAALVTARPEANGHGPTGTSLRLLSVPHGGKGAAVRAGMLAADADLIVFADADMATPPGSAAAARRCARRSRRGPRVADPAGRLGHAHEPAGLPARAGQGCSTCSRPIWVVGPGPGHAVRVQGLPTRRPRTTSSKPSGSRASCSTSS